MTGSVTRIVRLLIDGGRVTRRAIACVGAAMSVVMALALPGHSQPSPGALPPLVLLGDKDYPPLSYLENGVARGFDVDVARALSRTLGRSVRVELMDWADAQRRVLRGEADGLTDLAESADRRALYEFADFTIRHDFALFVRSDRQTIHVVDDLPSKRVGVTEGGFPREFLQRTPSIALVTIANYADGFERLAAGDLDAIATDLWVGAYTLERERLSGIVVAGPSFASLQAGIAVQKDNLALANDIARAVRALRADGTIGRIQETWRPKEMVFVSRERIRTVVEWTLAAAIVLAVGGMAVWVVTLRKQIRVRQAAEAELRLSEEKFAKAFEASPDFIAISDFGPEGIVEVNASFERITGYSRSEVLGHTLRDLGMVVGPPAREAVVATIRDKGSIQDFEYHIRRKDGAIVTLSLSAQRIEVGGRLCFLSVNRDITERKRFEALLRQAAESHKLLVSELELEALSVAVIESVHQIVDLDYASLVLCEAGSPLPSLRAQRSMLDSALSAAAAQTVAALALEQGDVRVLRKAELAALSQPAATLPAGLESVCALPLMTRREKLGALVVGSLRPDAFSGDDLTLLQQLSTYVAIAIQNARVYGELNTLKNRLSEEKLYLEQEIRGDYNFADIIGSSPAIREVLRQIETVAETEASVLLLGETGTGKELLARALHEHSPRKDRTFVRLNAAALPGTLLESEMFGYERGAFTGAVANKVGRMELAHRGTLFLDEVGDIPLEVQPKLLRVLQEKEFERLGSSRTQRVDVRIIAATNRDLEQMVEQGLFRSDLFYRLNVFPIRVPPLRDRPSDIPVLVQYFCQKFSQRFKRHITHIPAATMTALRAWHWPGNIRELEHVIERAVIVSTGDVLQVPAFQSKSPVEASTPPRKAPGWMTFADGEREMILKTLRETGGVIAGPDGAASRLGMKRTTLQSKMRKLGIRRPTF